MSGCLWLLIGSHGTGTLLSIIGQLIVCVMCLAVSLVFFVIRCKPCISQKRDELSPKEQQSWLIKMILNVQLMVIPFLFTIDTMITVPNFTLDLHREMPLNDSWNDIIKSKCSFDNENDSIDSTISLITAISALLAYLGLISIYFSRLVVIFLNSIYSIDKRVKIIFGMGCVVCVTLIISMIVIIIIMGRSGRAVGSMLIGIGLIIFIALTVYFHKTLMKQFRAIINFSKSVNYNNNNNNHQYSGNSNINIAKPKKPKRKMKFGKQLQLKVIKSHTLTKSGSAADAQCVEIGQTNEENEEIDTRLDSQNNKERSLRRGGDGKTRAFWRTLVRLTILYLVSLLSTAMVTIGTVICFTMGYFDASIEVRCILTIFMQLDCFVNILCILFQFPQFEKGYRLLCGCCDIKLNDKYDQYN